MRLIDEHELICKIVELPDLRTLSTGAVGKCIKECRTIDAVPVVRCKECKHREVFFNDPALMFCHKWLRTMPTDLNFFCAYGEKMDAEVEG